MLTPGGRKGSDVDDEELLPALGTMLLTLVAREGVARGTMSTLLAREGVDVDDEELFAVLGTMSTLLARKGLDVDDEELLSALGTVFTLVGREGVDVDDEELLSALGTVLTLLAREGEDIDGEEMLSAVGRMLTLVAREGLGVDDEESDPDEGESEAESSLSVSTVDFFGSDSMTFISFLRLPLILLLLLFKDLSESSIFFCWSFKFFWNESSFTSTAAYTFAQAVSNFSSIPVTFCFNISTSLLKRSQ